MRKPVAWFALPATAALGATMALAPTASAAIPPPQVIRVDGGGFDTAGSITTDRAGNTYVGASLTGSGSSNGSFAVIKINAQGGVVWRARVNGGANTLGNATDLATDAAGNVYAVGFIRGTAIGSIGESVLAKFSPSGQELFVRRGTAGFGRLAIGADGAIYGAGGNGNDITVSRLTADGGSVWTRTIGTPSAFERLGGIAVAPNGNVAVSVSTNGNGDGMTFDFDTNVFDPQGNTVWRQVFTVDNLSHEVVTDVAVDSASRVIVTGTTANNVDPEAGGPSNHGITIRYAAADGAVLSMLDPSPSTALDVDRADNIYLAGFVNNVGTPESVVKLDSAGNVVANVGIAPDPNGSFTALHAEVDSTGALTVAGNLARGGLNLDYLTVRYNPAVQELGRHAFGGNSPISPTDRVVGLAINSQDAALVTGTSRNSTNDVVTLRFGGGGGTDPTPPPVVTPAAPSGLTANAASRSRIDLNWQDNSDNETGFRIEQCQGAGCTNFTAIATVGANVTSFRNTNLPRNTTFTYRVQAINAAGASAFSNTATAATRR